jgi:hypothetical protein
MKWLALGFAVQILACAVVGVRLLLLWRRTRKLPEASFGIAFLVLGVLGFPVSMAARNGLAASPQAAGLLLALGFAAQDAGLMALYVGIWRVFRPGQAWAAAIVATAGLLFAASLLGQALTVGFEGGRDTGFWYWLGNATRGFTFFWAFAESSRYTGLMRRRVHLGLADPELWDRFRLWSIATGALVVAWSAFAGSRLAGVDAASSPPVLGLSAAAGVASGIALWLAFFPPRAYLRRLSPPRPAAPRPR